MKQTNDVFIWKEFIPKSNYILDWLRTFVSSHLWDEVIKDPEKFLDKEKKNGTTTIDKLVEKFSGKFQAIQLFHACRPQNVDEYYRNGIVPLDVLSANTKAKSIFLSPKCPSVNETILNEVISDFNKRNRVGKLYFALDDRDIVCHANHYLEFGSEYLNVIATHLGALTGDDCKGVLLNIGIPTIFTCNIPIKLIDISYLMETLVRCAVLYLKNEITQNHLEDLPFEFNTPIPGSFIKSHYHPS